MTDLQRVLIIENAIGPTGSVFSVLRSSAHFNGRYHFEFVLPTGSTAASTVENDGFDLHEIPMRELQRNLPSIILYFPALLVNTIRLRRVLRRRDIKLVVNNDFYNLLSPLVRILGGTGPYVCYVRFMPSKFPGPLVRFWFGMHERYATRIIAVSEAVKRELPASNKVVVVHNELPPVDVAFQHAASTVLLYPSNYITGKGQELALEAFAHVVRDHPDWMLRFVGGDMGLDKNKAFRSMLIKRSEELGLTRNVTFLDFSDNLAQHYQEAAIVLNFSESESFSLTTLEAQFYGRPVIATRCGGPEEIIADGETGTLVPLKDIAAMTRAMAYLIANDDARRKMGERGYHHVRDKFSYANTVGKLADIYRSAIEMS